MARGAAGQADNWDGGWCALPGATPLAGRWWAATPLCRHRHMAPPVTIHATYLLHLLLLNKRRWRGHASAWTPACCAGRQPAAQRGETHTQLWLPPWVQHVHTTLTSLAFPGI